MDFERGIANEKSCSKFVPHVLTADQKQSRVDACRELKEHLEINTALFSKVITGDESWCYAYDPETKQQSSEWKSSNSPRPKKVWRVKSNVKTMLISFDANGIVPSEFAPNGETVNQAFYLQVLKSLRDAVRRKRPELWQSGEWWLHHDNASAHKALSVQQLFNQKQHDSASPPAIFTRSCSVRLLFISPNEKSPQRKTFCGRGRGEEKNDRGIKRHHFGKSFRTASKSGKHV